MTQVGDRHVVEAMRREGAVLGGEDSGHLILAERHTTGDGLLTGLLLLDVMRSESKPLSQLKAVMTPFPQVLLNVPVRSKPRFEDVPRIHAAMRAAELELGDDGRVLVRYSGTEPLCRVMVEGPTAEKTERICRSRPNSSELPSADVSGSKRPIKKGLGVPRPSFPPSS